MPFVRGSVGPAPREHVVPEIVEATRLPLDNQESGVDLVLLKKQLLDACVRISMQQLLLIDVMPLITFSAMPFTSDSKSCPVRACGYRVWTGSKGIGTLNGHAPVLK